MTGGAVHGAVPLDMADSEPFPGLRELRREFLRIGAAHFGRYPWHLSADPFALLVAEVLLQRTKRVVVARVLPELLKVAPDAHSLGQMELTVLECIIWSTGLASRARRLRELGNHLVALGGVPRDREALLSLPNVGPYVADAVRLYAFGIAGFPLDRNVQRVLTRVFYGVEPDRKIAPYSDTDLVVLLGPLVEGLGPLEVRNIHQGVLAVAWDNCGPHPKQSGCPLLAHCRFALRSSR